MTLSKEQYEKSCPLVRSGMYSVLEGPEEKVVLKFCKDTPGNEPDSKRIAQSISTKALSTLRGCLGCPFELECDPIPSVIHNFEEETISPVIRRYVDL